MLSLFCLRSLKRLRTPRKSSGMRPRAKPGFQESLDRQIEPLGLAAIHGIISSRHKSILGFYLAEHRRCSVISGRQLNLTGTMEDPAPTDV